MIVLVESEPNDEHQLLLGIIVGLTNARVLVTETVLQGVEIFIARCSRDIIGTKIHLNYPFEIVFYLSLLILYQVIGNTKPDVHPG